jgi:hypothetical protein
MIREGPGGRRLGGPIVRAFARFPDFLSYKQEATGWEPVSSTGSQQLGDIPQAGCILK